MTAGPTRFQAPTGEDIAGTRKITRGLSGYERYMKREGIPVHEGPGFHDVRELDLGAWTRRGCEGAFLVLDELTDLLGLFVLRLAPGGSTSPERHLYEERYWVVEGDGATEFRTPQGKKRVEWHAGALFAIPLNLEYRIVNEGPKAAVLLAGNYAPRVLDLFEDPEFVFGSDRAFPDRYDGSSDYFAPHLDLLAAPETGRALWRTAVIPDIVGSELPLDNWRTKGYRRVELKMANGNLWGFIGEYPSGKYSKAHRHPSGAALICVKGKGYTYHWPGTLGTTPWADGHGDAVERVDYGPGGLVAAAPGSGDWFHQHFGVGREHLRMLMFYGGQPGGPAYRHAGRFAKTQWGGDIEEGGNQIRFEDEDPHIREEYQRMLRKEGLESLIPQPA
jgi:mannose-6-phosphate isomerase-like protein (cupin superfamily)